jgi:GTP-binding protein
MIPLTLTPVKLYFREKTGKIEFSGNTKEFRRIQEKKKKVMTKRDKQRKEQSRKKRERDQKNTL